jgi:hypothetical protein
MSLANIGGGIMGRGNIKSLDWKMADASLDMVLSELTVDEIWLEDLTCRVIDKYVQLSRHHVIQYNTYPKSRFQNCITKKRLLEKGWECKRRTSHYFVTISGNPKPFPRQRTKAFRIGEEE